VKTDTDPEEDSNACQYTLFKILSIPFS